MAAFLHLSYKHVTHVLQHVSIPYHHFYLVVKEAGQVIVWLADTIVVVMASC